MGRQGWNLCTNLPATIAEEMSRLVLTEFELSTTGSQLADFINTQLERELTDLDIHVERYCAKGGIVMKPYVSVGPTGLPEKIEIDFVEADHFYRQLITARVRLCLLFFYSISAWEISCIRDWNTMNLLEIALPF